MQTVIYQWWKRRNDHDWSSLNVIVVAPSRRLFLRFRVIGTVPNFNSGQWNQAFCTYLPNGSGKPFLNIATLRDVVEEKNGPMNFRDFRDITFRKNLRTVSSENSARLSSLVCMAIGGLARIHKSLESISSTTLSKGILNFLFYVSLTIIPQNTPNHIDHYPLTIAHKNQKHKNIQVNQDIIKPKAEAW